MNDIMTNYGHASFMLDSPLIEYNRIEKLEKRTYLLALKTNEEAIEKLDDKSRMNAYFNEMATFYIIDAICSTIRDDKSLAMQMMKKEIKRIQSVINSYKSGNIEKYSIWEMKSILSEYIDEEKINQFLTGLYKDQVIIKSDDVAETKGAK